MNRDIGRKYGDMETVRRRRRKVVELVERGMTAERISESIPLSPYRIRKIAREEGVANPRGRPSKGTKDGYVR